MQALENWQGSAKLVDYRRVKWFGAWYMFEYRLLNMSKWWGAIVAFGLGNPILYLTSVGLGIGALINAGSPQGVDGVPYLIFLAPSLLATAAIQTVMDETMFPTTHGFVWAKVFYSINNSALTSRQIANGVMLAALLRGILTVVAYYAIMVMFGAIGVGAGLWSIVTGIFAGWAMGAAMLAMASHVEQDGGLYAIVGRFVIAPMFLFSGTFFPLSSLPIYLQWIGWISPLWHATDLGRYLSYNHPLDGWLIAVHFGFLLVVGLVGTWLALKQYKRRLSR